MELAGLIFLGIGLFISGAVCLLLYMVIRMLRSKDWDDSNITNALRVISHVVAHPNDFSHMYYLTDTERKILSENGQVPKKPFWYIGKDEFSEVVRTRYD
jgi:hypothetical protein